MEALAWGLYVNDVMEKCKFAMLNNAAKRLKKREHLSVDKHSIN